MSKRFFQVISVEECTSRIAALPPLDACYIPPALAVGLALAQHVVASENIPPADRAAMDGYAVHAEDTFGASDGNPAYLEEKGSIAITVPAAEVVLPGDCMGIVTGAWMPQGADAVLMVEHSEDMGAGTIEVRRTLAPGENIVRCGDDAQAGVVALQAGTVLRPQEIGFLAALGVHEVAVHRRPKVALLSSGDEIVAPDTQLLSPGQMRDVNGPALQTMMELCGADADLGGIVPDALADLEVALLNALEDHDVVFLSGGSSVGVRDFTLEAISRLAGAEILVQGVAIKPGKPLIVAHIPDWQGKGQRIIWGLPGQVSSAQVVMHVLGLPFLRQLMGWRNSYDQRLWPARRAVLARNIASAQGREDYIRIRLEARPGALPLAHVVTAPSGLLRSLLAANALLRIPASSEGMLQGAEVDCLLL